MRHFALVALVVLISACSAAVPPVIAPSPGPDDAAGPSADLPYRSVMAGTAYHGVGSQP